MTVANATQTETTLDHTEYVNRFGDSPHHRKSFIAAGGRWVQVLYTSGQGTPQIRDILARADESAAQAALGLLQMPGYENERILAAAEDGDDLSEQYFAALLG